MTATAERTKVGVMSTLDESGDTRVMWNRDVPAEVEAAKLQFKKLVKDHKYAAFRATGERGEKGEQIRDFDPAAERIILVPPMVGG